MFPNEAIWIGDVLKRLMLQPSPPTKLLNIGSSSKTFRQTILPWMDEVIFKPLVDQNITVVHSDLKQEDGVDLAGDIFNPDFHRMLKEAQFSLVLCSNVLEHLVNRQDFCVQLEALVADKGYIVVTVPKRYPYHNDPIDTMFRPSVNELKHLFPNTIAIASAVVKDNKTYWNKLMENPRLAAVIMFRSFLPFYKPVVWWNTVRYLPFLFCRFQVTCLVIQKNK